jgi:hypothetical protein
MRVLKYNSVDSRNLLSICEGGEKESLGFCRVRERGLNVSRAFSNGGYDNPTAF